MAARNDSTLVARWRAALAAHAFRDAASFKAHGDLQQSGEAFGQAIWLRDQADSRDVCMLYRASYRAGLLQDEGQEVHS